MARACTVCASEHRVAIELGLVSGIGERVLSDRFNALGAFWVVFGIGHFWAAGSADAACLLEPDSVCVRHGLAGWGGRIRNSASPFESGRVAHLVGKSLG
jgi:hypothetical protein